MRQCFGMATRPNIHRIFTVGVHKEHCLSRDSSTLSGTVTSHHRGNCKGERRYASEHMAGDRVLSHCLSSYECTHIETW
jgi:hypothetical protein